MKNKISKYGIGWKELNAKEEPRVIDVAGFVVVFALLFVVFLILMPIIL